MQPLSNRTMIFLVGFRKFFIISAFGLITSQAQASLEAVELELVPADVKADCNRSFFKSSIGQSRALYITPHVVAGRTPISGNKREVHIETTPIPGKYVMNVGVFFPRDAEDATNAYEMRDAQANFCNFESVLHWINEGKREQDKFKTVEHLPLTSIEVAISGLNLPAHIIGRVAKVNGEQKDQEVDILEYNDRSYTAQFVIDDSDLDYINARLSRDSGLQLNVKYRFQARKKDGSIDVSIDAKEISAHFKAAAKGKKFLVQADLKVAIQAAVSKSNIQINEKAGSSADFQKISNKIVEKVLESVNFESVPANLTAEDVTVSDDVDEVISVKAVAKYLSSELNRKFSYSRVTTPSKTTAETVVKVFSRPIDPRVKEVELRDGFPPVEFSNQIKKGQTIKITPAYSFVAQREWMSKESHLTLNQLQPLGVLQHFPDLYNSKMVLTNEVYNGRLRAVGTWWNFYAIKWIFDPTYQWRRIQRFPVRVHRNKLKRIRAKGREDLDSIPVLVSFSGMGGGYHLYTLDELLEEKAAWSAEFKESSVVLTAKKDLGLMVLRETIDIKKPYYDEKEKGKYVYKFRADQEELDVVVQEYHCALGFNCGKTDDGRRVIKNRVDQWAIKMYKAVVLAITRPSIGEEQPKSLDIKKDIRADARVPNR